MAKCSRCNKEVPDSLDKCPDCGAEIMDYPKPAGFWIRVVASFVDSLVFIPLSVLSLYILSVVKSLPLMLLISIPGLLYKPFMESRFGATLGKMACKLRVIDKDGKKLNLTSAYIRFSPFLLTNIISIIGLIFLFSFPQFKDANTLAEIGYLQRANPMRLFQTVTSWIVLIDCVCVAFTYRKRALHDMIAKSYCIRV